MCASSDLIPRRNLSFQTWLKQQGMNSEKWYWGKRGKDSWFPGQINAPYLAALLQSVWIPIWHPKSWNWLSLFILFSLLIPGLVLAPRTPTCSLIPANVLPFPQVLQRAQWLFRPFHQCRPIVSLELHKLPSWAYMGHLITYPWPWFPQLQASSQVLHIVFISNETAFSLATECQGLFSLFLVGLGSPFQAIVLSQHSPPIRRCLVLNVDLLGEKVAPNKLPRPPQVGGTAIMGSLNLICS